MRLGLCTRVPCSVYNSIQHRTCTDPQGAAIWCKLSAHLGVMASLLASAVVQARGQAMASSLEQLIHSINLTRIASLPLCRSFASGSAVSTSAQQQEPQASTSYGGALEKLQRRRKQLAYRDDKKALAEYEASRAEEPGVGPKEPMRFVSTNQTHSPKAPARRIPICFPDFTLQLMKLTDAEVKQVEKTGWLREAAFKTTPNMTKAGDG